jgi:membrane protein YdbS with pleckstrin-like domain
MSFHCIGRPAAKLDGKSGDARLPPRNSTAVRGCAAPLRRFCRAASVAPLLSRRFCRAASPRRFSALSSPRCRIRVGAPVPDLIIQPTQKSIRFQYWTIFVVLCVCVGLYVNKFSDKVSPWVLVVPALLFVFPLRAHLRRHFTKMTLAGDKLRYESGVFSKTTRTVPVSKIQDVRADQTLVQRLMGIGNVTVENAGETGRLAILGIDDPQAVVEAILDAQGPAAKRKGESA